MPSWKSASRCSAEPDLPTLSVAVSQALRGGMRLLQYRAKGLPAAERLRQAKVLQQLCAEHDALFIINDDVELAAAVHAAGVHLGQTDMPLDMAKRIIGDSMIIGISAESLDDAIQAEKGGADYLGVSPIYNTPTKTDTAPPVGLKGLRAIREAVNIPLVGIGGLNLNNSADVIRSGGNGIAVVSAIVAADDPEAAARNLRQSIDKAGKV